MSYYPNLTESMIIQLQVVVKSLEQNPKYLQSPDCPYSDAVKDFFTKNRGVLGSGRAVSAEVEDLFEGKDDVLVLEEQIKKLLNELEDMSAALGSMETSEKLAFMKTKSQLIERLITMQERVMNLKEVAMFRHTVIGFMEEVLEKDQIADFMDRLQNILGIRTEVGNEHD